MHHEEQSCSSAQRAQLACQAILSVIHMILFFSVHILSTSFQKYLSCRHCFERVYWGKQELQKKDSIHFMCINQICTRYASTFPTMKNTVASLHRGRGHKIGNRKKKKIMYRIHCFALNGVRSVGRIFMQVLYSYFNMS